MRHSTSRRLLQLATHRRGRIVAITLASALVLIITGNLIVTRSYLPEDQRTEIATVPLSSFYPPNAAEQTFMSHCDGLGRIDVWLSSPQEPHYVRVALQTDDRQTVGTAEFLVPSGQHMRHSLIFSAIPDSAGQQFRLLWQGQGFPLALEVSPTDVYRQGVLSISGTPTGSDLDMMLYYRPSTPRALGCVLSARARTAWSPIDRLLIRMSQYKPDLLKKDCLVALGTAFLVTVLLLIASLLSGTRQRTPSLAGQIFLSSLLGASLVVTLTARLLAQDRIWLSDNTIQLTPEGIPPGVGEGRRITDDLILALEKPSTQITTLEDWYVAIKWLDVDGYRPAVWLHPPSRVSFTVIVPPEGQLSFGVGVGSEVWEKQESDGVEFEVTVATATTIEQVYWRAVDPRHNPGDRRWFDEQIDLSSFAGQEAAITLITYPRGNNSWDWAAWSHPTITSLP